ncbi:pentapeptide repeat-containing protein [Pendulispora albinea]|uniref:pentapeptide repeat-containing protein n=1 Tax=Pendulispora albinea TaxID=2741071 RepID=UPI00374E05BA
MPARRTRDFTDADFRGAKLDGVNGAGTNLAGRSRSRRARSQYARPLDDHGSIFALPRGWIRLIWHRRDGGWVRIFAGEGLFEVRIRAGALDDRSSKCNADHPHGLSAVTRGEKGFPEAGSGSSGTAATGDWCASSPVRACSRFVFGRARSTIDPRSAMPTTRTGSRR